MLFFVLSGSVLSKTYIEKDRSYLPFAIKRIARIYIPFAVAILCAALLVSVLGHALMPGVSPWFDMNGWHQPNSVRLLLGHLAMGSNMELDGAAWSLVHELRISLILPLIAILAARRWRTALIGATILALIAAAVSPAVSSHSDVLNLLATVAYLPLFAAGAALMLSGTPLIKRLSLLPRIVQVAILTAALLLITTAPISSWPVNTMTLSMQKLGLILASGIGAVALISFGLTDSWLTRRVLDHRVSVYLGYISYSLYLLHLIVLEVLIRVLNGRAPFYLAILLTPPLSIAVAHLSRRTVEEWSQSLGRRLAAKWQRSHSVPVARISS